MPEHGMGTLARCAGYLRQNGNPDQRGICPDWNGMPYRGLTPRQKRRSWKKIMRRHAKRTASA